MSSLEPARALRAAPLTTLFALAVGLSGCPGDFGLADAGDSSDAATSGASCGSRGQAACSDDEYCSYPSSAQCGAADAPGTCKPRPEVCDDIYAPVCGCDGKTYPNDCNAAGGGSSVAYTGKCKGDSDAGTPDAGQGGASCGGLQGKQCGDGEFCKFGPDAQCGAADQTGTCSKKPEFCTRQYSPVCGCDGKTYGNDCEAASAGISIVSKGECAGTEPDAGPSARACGGLRGLKCASGEFCNFPPDAICGAADATGTCESIPSACTADYNPVCGCDGNTYGNACSAHVAGISVQAKGECPSNGGTSCGGLIGGGCAKGEFCNFPPDAICGAADGPGVCSAIPDVCTEQYAPVCGCDGKTYGNACAAAAASMSIVSQGECGSASSCGGLQGKACADGQYCNFAKDAQCGAADQTGVCTEIPQACTKELNPVCGCDDKTYSNPCLAAAAGVSVATPGECSIGSGTFCGGFAGKQCEAKSEFCNFPESTNCGSGDQGGTCSRIPDVCTLEYSPVCGCDGKTYATRCAAAAAAQSVQATGECK